jgi:hypothetical protein
MGNLKHPIAKSTAEMQHTTLKTESRFMSINLFLSAFHHESMNTIYPQP